MDTTALVSYMVNPSPEQEEEALPKRDQICQSDHMLEWLHALATITVMKEPADPHVAQPHRQPQPGPLDF